MNWLKFLVGFSAIIIAGCAAYFSVTGLGVLFSGASISVMVMASSLELAKLVSATYLKQEWNNIKGFNKWYLTISVGLLMLITSAGIFGYLSNAFQAQSLQLQQVDREIAVHQTKIDQNTTQITQLSTQITEFNTNQGKILDGGKVNSRLIRSIDNRDKQISKINDKISKLQEENASETEKINQIKISNLNLEKEVGGFRFVAEAFGMELKNVVKFFIFLIVIVFDPLAVALIIAFNGLIGVKKKTREELLSEMAQNNQKMGLYEVYGDTEVKEWKEYFDNLEKNQQNINNSENIIQSEEDSKLFFDTIENPPAPVDALIEAKEKYEEDLKKKSMKI
jgi:septal ring factor EnvC (AmiA/AmiB activator)